MIWMVIWVVLMMFWLFGGGYLIYRADPTRPYLVGNVLVPWLAVLLLGLIVFGALSPGVVVVR